MRTLESPLSPLRTLESPLSPLSFSGLRPTLDPNTSRFSLLNASSPQLLGRIKRSNPLSIFATLSKSINNKSKIPNPDINNNGNLPDSNNSQIKVANHVNNALPEILHAPQPSDLNLADLISLNSGPSFPATACNIADSLITSFLTPSQLKPSIDPDLQLAGNCSPVPETPPTPCNIVRGILPSDLNGVYLRNGPNATRLHQREGYHMFDGDGMLHSVRLKDGNATFCARYVKTSRFRQEEAAGRPLFPKFFGGFYGVAGVARTAVTVLRAGLGLLNVTEGWGLSNTSVGFFNGQILSMSEDDMPYVVKVTEGGDLITTGNFELPFKMNMCAHPKFDATTGEMFAFSFNPPFVPPFSFFRVSADGVKSPDVPVPMMDIPLVHDFAITRRYVIFPDSQLVVRPTEFLKGEMPMVCDAGKTARFCLLPRYALPEEAAQKARWFEAPGCNCIHYINAWEEGPDEVVLITPVLSPAERILELPAVNTSCTLSEIRFNTSTGRAHCRKVCSGNFEFGTVNQKHIGRKAKYAYLASGFYPKLTGVVKVNLQSASTEIDAVVGRREFGENCYGSEPCFVPRNNNDGSSHAVAEDDGYLVCFVHNEATGVSQLLVMDALSPSLEVIAAVQLPSRVPYGFHGWFVNEQQLAKQA